MDLLLILTYGAFCVFIFKVFKIPLNKWTVPTAVLGGVVLIASLLLIMNYNHPYSRFGREYFVTIPITPAVRGLVISVDVLPNTPVKEGDVLFRIDPTPFQAVVDRKKAALIAAKQDVPQLGATWEAAKANVARATADRDRTKSAYSRYEQGHRKGGANSPFTDLELDNRRQMYLSSEAQLTAAQADELKARLAYESNVDGVNTQVVALEADLASAMYDLEHTIVRAPADGMVTQMALRPGTMAVPMPLRPVMTFIPDEERYFAGAFWQNSILRLKVGDEAEVVLDAAPGQVFSGKVAKILPAMAEGEIQTNGTLLSATQLYQSGRVIVIIDIDDDAIRKQFPAGVQGQVAVYSEHFHHISVMRKVLLRMKGWLNYLFFDGH
ncbi:HlyD family secretion protein [Shewanella acanthi]|uniref:HlyD family secretion protein n=1 Tax=Shewanella acanthi TaxID=2864212 RepID=UPI001C661BA6|nr:HlyD family secretion protein [Shewanella acanthi]QYJ78125.1 HlyD family secretion protein [Shewanella acanthi]